MQYLIDPLSPTNSIGQIIQLHVCVVSLCPLHNSTEPWFLLEVYSAVSQGALISPQCQVSTAALAKQLRLGPGLLTALPKDWILLSFMNSFQTKSKTSKNVPSNFHLLRRKFLQNMFCFIFWPSPLDSPKAPKNLKRGSLVTLSRAIPYFYYVHSAM